MDTTIAFKTCGPFGRKGEWTKRNLRKYLGMSRSDARAHTKTQMCKLASWRAQRMTVDLIRLRATEERIWRLKAHQKKYLDTYLIPSPTEFAERDESYWGKYDSDFRMTLLDYCGDGSQSTSMSAYLKGMTDKFSDVPASLATRIANKANTLNTLIQQAPPSPVELVLYRAVDVPRTGPPSFPFDERAPHVDFLKLGLLSTSYVKQDAIDFLDDGEPCCLCVLLCPVGTRCLLVDALSAWAESEHEVILPSGNLFRLQHSYFETVTSRLSGARFDVRVLVCVLDRQFLPDDAALQRIVPNSKLDRLPYSGQHVPPPTHKPYVLPAKIEDVIDLTDDDVIV